MIRTRSTYVSEPLTAAMEVSRQSFTRLDVIVDELHALFELWIADGALLAHLDGDTVELLRLAVHEWVANLVQHADFAERSPVVTLSIIPNGRRVRCVIEDNSAGFPLDEKLENRRKALEPLPERGMGLLMLNAATEYFEYTTSEDGRQRLEFTVSADSDPWLNIPF